jgi:hypothetical protein
MCIDPPLPLNQQIKIINHKSIKHCSFNARTTGIFSQPFCQHSLGCISSDQLKSVIAIGGDHVIVTSDSGLHTDHHSLLAIVQMQKPSDVTLFVQRIARHLHSNKEQKEEEKHHFLKKRKKKKEKEKKAARLNEQLGPPLCQSLEQGPQGTLRAITVPSDELHLFVQVQHLFAGGLNGRRGSRVESVQFEIGQIDCNLKARGVSIFQKKK